jgi:transposase InsO family protein
VHSPGAGHEFAHSIVDDCSRLAYTELHDDERADTVTAFTERALDWFLDHGIVAERLLTDNAWAYTKNRSLSQLLLARAIEHKRTRPYTPKTNGKVERYQQTMDREWGRGVTYNNSADRRAPCQLARALQHPQTPQRDRQPDTHQPRSQRPGAGQLVVALEPAATAAVKRLFAS